MPSYDFKTHSRRRTRKLVAPKPIILLDGLWLLRRKTLRRLFTLRIFLQCSFRTRLRRRLARDLVSRGRSAASVRRQFRETVEPMHARFVAPQAARAELVFKHDCTEAQVRGLAKLLCKFLEAE